MVVDWRVLIVIATLLKGLETIIFKKLSTDERGEPVSVMLLFVIPILLPFIKAFPDSVFAWIAPLLAVILYAVGRVLFFQGYSKGEVSVLAPISNFSPLILLTLSVPILGESLTLTKLLGILLIVYGASQLKKGKNIKESLQKLWDDKSVQFVFLAILLFNLARVTDKVNVGSMNVYNYTLLLYTGPPLLVFLYLLIQNRAGEVTELFQRKPVYSVLTGVTVGVRNLIYLMALKQAEVSVVFPILSTSVIIAMLLSHFLLKESIQEKIIGAIIMIIGAITLVSI